MKPDRKLIYDKYGGKCAYCGEDLPPKGWHVDHIEPVCRQYKYVPGHWSEGFRPGMTEQELIDANVKWIEGKSVPVGLAYPERDCMENKIPACASCNINKHGDSVEGFRSTIKKFVESLNRYSVQYKVAKRYGLLSEVEKPVVFYFETVIPPTLTNTPEEQYK